MSMSKSIVQACSKFMHRRLPAVGRAYRHMADRRWQSRTVKVDGLRLCLPPGMVNSDPQERAAILNEMRNADAFIDVGANVGLYSCLAASTSKQVLAIEPLRQNLDVLSHNISLNPSLQPLIEIVPVGVSDREGSAVIYGFGSVASLNSKWNATANSHHETVTLSTLDNLLGRRFANAKLLIKIDVEGYEFSVLQGAKQILARAPKPTWLVEIFRNFPATGELNSNYDATFSIFKSCGYSVNEVDEKNFVFKPFAE